MNRQKDLDRVCWKGLDVGLKPCEIAPLQDPNRFDCQGKAQNMQISIEGRRGQFLDLPPKLREKTILKFRKRIRDGYYSSDKILSSICEKIAPCFDDNIERFI